MTTTPTQEIAATLEWLRTTGQNAIDTASPFLAEQTPLYVEELIRWQIALGIVCVVGFVLWLIIFAGLGVFLFWKIECKGRDQWIPVAAFSAFFGMIGGLFLVVNAIVEGYAAFQAWLAPRVYIAQHFAEMIQ